MAYLYAANLDSLDRRDQLEIMLDNGDSAILRHGHYYNLSANELGRARQYVIMTYVATAPDEDPVGVRYLPLKGNPTNGQIPMFVTLDGAFAPADVPGVSGGPFVTQAQMDAAIAAARQEIDYLPTLSLQSLADRDGIDLFSSNGVWAQFLTDSWAEAAAAGRALLLPPGVILMKGQDYPIGGAIRPPLVNPQLIGAGLGRSIIRSHPSLLGSSPLISYPVEGGGAEINDLVLADLTFDGNFHDNTAFNTRCTLTAPYTLGDTTITCAGGIPAGFPASQAHPAGGQFDDAPQPDVQYFNYTSRDSTHFYGCTPDGAGKRDQPVGMEIFWRDRSGLGLVRFYSAQRMSMVRVEICNGPGYGFGLEARPDIGEIESDLYMEEVWSHNNGSDGADLKMITRFTIIRSNFSDNADTGFDPRGQHGTMIGCIADRNSAGINISASRPILPECWADLTITTTKTATSLTLTPRVLLTDIPVSGSGVIRTEEIDWTGRTDNGNGTLTITGVTRGARGTKAAAHVANDGDPARLVPDLSELTTPKLSEVEPTAADFEWSTDLIGCTANFNRGPGFVLDGGGSNCYVRISVLGGTAKGNGSTNLNAHGSRGHLYLTVSGGHYVDAGSDNVSLIGVHHATFTSTQISGARGLNGSGDGILVTNCGNGITTLGVQIRNNAGRPVRLGGITDYCNLNGEVDNNTQGDTVAEATGNKHNRGDLFGTGRVLQGLMRALLPVSDAGSAASTLPTIWSNLLDRREITSNVIAACITQRLELFPVWLPKGLPITRMGVLIGGTGSGGITNSWFALYDELFALLVQTPDGTGGVQAAADHYSRPVTYTPATDGLYWVGLMVKATTCPTYAGRPTLATGIVPWARIITTNTGLTATAPSTATPAAAPGGEGAGTPYIFFK